MDKETAKRVHSVMLRCSREIHDLVPFLKERLDGDEYETFAKGLALVSVYILTEVLNPLHSQHPELNRDD